MKGFAIIFLLVVVLFGCLTAMAGEPVGEGGSYVPKQEAEQANKSSIETLIDNLSKQQGQELWGQWGQQGVDAAKAVNGRWQLQWQIQTVAGTFPYTVTETWRWDARQGIFWDNEGWMWKGKTAGNYLQVKTKLVTGADAMLTIQFLSNNEATGSMSVSATQNLSPVYGQFRATRVQ